MTVVAAPELTVGRARKDAPNKWGCVVQLEASQEETARVEAAAAQKTTDKENKVETFWAKWRGSAREAEAALQEAGGSPGAMKEAKGAYVARLKALYVSRVAKAPPAAWNNKASEDGTEGKLLQEVRVALAAHEDSQVPPTPTRLALDEAVDEEEAVGDAAVITCEDCGRELAEEGVQPKDGEELPANRDFYIGDGGRALYRCGAPAEELDRA